MKKLVLVPNSETAVVLPESSFKPQRASTRWQGALICCALAYVLCVLVTTAPIYNMLGLKTQFGISLAIVKVDSWLNLPLDLGFTADHTISRGDTLYFEFALLVLLAFVIYGVCAYVIWREERGSDRVLEVSRAGASPAPTIPRGGASYYTFVMWLIWVTVVVVGCIYVFMPASLSDDVFGYASYGRLLSVHHVNPYFVSPSAFQQDPTYPLIHWKDAFAPYGPVWVVLSAVVGLIAGHGRLEYLIAFRVCAFAAHLFNIWLVMATLRTMGRSARTVAVGTLLYAWNPLVVLESTLGGHNDVFMLTFILLGLLLSARVERGGASGVRSSIPALVAFTLAGLVKLTAFPVLAFPVLRICWDVYRAREETAGLPVIADVPPARRTQTLRCAPGETGFHKGPPLTSPHPRPYGNMATFPKNLNIRRWGSALLAGLVASLVCVGVALVAYAPFWVGHSIQQIMVSFTSQPTETYNFNSLLAALGVWQKAHSLPALLALFNSRHVWNVMTVAAIGLGVMLGAAWLWRAPTTRMVALAALAVLAAFLLVTPWFTSWYVTWLVGLAAVCLPVARDRLARSLFVLALTFSVTAFLTYYYVSIGHVLLVYHADNVTWFIVVCLATFGIPVLGFVLSWVTG